MKKLLLAPFLICFCTAICFAGTPASPLVGVWYGALGGPGNHLILRIAGDPGRYTATTDSVDQKLVALPTGIAMDTDNNVTIKVAEPSPLTFTGVLKAGIITGTWAEDTHSGPLVLTRSDSASLIPVNEPLPHLAGTWEGIRSGIAFHFIFHITGSPGLYKATADSPDQNADGLNAGVKIDAMDNVFLSIGFQHPLYFTGVIVNDEIPGTWSQAGDIGEMTLTRVR